MKLFKNFTRIKLPQFKKSHKTKTFEAVYSKKRHEESNREIGVITYVFLGVFLCLLVYLGIFTQFQGPQIINNNYNKRQSLLESRIVRGQILSRERNVLAETKSDGDGGYYRTYPYRNVFSHIVGYSTHGVLGVESIENFTLLTSDSNIVTRISNDLSGTKNHGDNVITTLHTDMQLAAYDALEDRNGCIFAMDVRTGEILCCVSKPDFDPNEVIGKWDKLNADKERSPLLNRAFLGLYAPGSTFKIVTALEYLKEHNGNVDDYTFDCTGSFEKEGSVINCFHEETHGEVDFKKSFAKSCNSSFANISYSLDKGDFEKTLRELLFYEKLPLPLSYSIGECDINSSSSTDDLLQTGIGQGRTLISPAHMTLITSAIANDGVLMRPYVVDSIENFDGGVIRKTRVKEYKRLIDEEYAKDLQELMREVVVNGTATKAADTGNYIISGKTGSAEYSSNKTQSHAWFTGFSAKADPEIAISVIVEGGGSGGAIAAPIAKRVLDAYYSE